MPDRNGEAPLRSEHDIVLARQLVRKLTQELGFSLVDQTKMVTAASELARNAYTYGRGGTMHWEVINGGERRESNLKPWLSEHHPKKTAADVAEKSRVYRKRAKHLGVALRKGPKIASRGFQKRPPQRTASRPVERRT